MQARSIWPCLDKCGDRAASCHFSSQAPRFRAAHFDITAKTPHSSTRGSAAKRVRSKKGGEKKRKKNNRILYSRTSLTTSHWDGGMGDSSSRFGYSLWLKKNCCQMCRVWFCIATENRRENDATRKVRKVIRATGLWTEILNYVGIWNRLSDGRGLIARSYTQLDTHSLHTANIHLNSVIQSSREQFSNWRSVITAPCFIYYHIQKRPHNK